MTNPDIPGGEILTKFRDEWRAAGWWAEAAYDPGVEGKPPTYMAALFSPEALKEMIEEDYAASVSFYNGMNEVARVNYAEPVRRDMPPLAVVNTSPNWSKERTAQAACVGAIILALELYPTVNVPRSPAVLAEMIQRRSTTISDEEYAERLNIARRTSEIKADQRREHRATAASSQRWPRRAPH